MSTILLQIGVAVLALTYLSLLVSFSCPAWIVGGDDVLKGGVWLGLFKACVEDGCVSIFASNDMIMKQLGDWFFVSFGCAVAGFFCTTIAVIVTLCYFAITSWRFNFGHLWRTSLLLVVSGIVYGVSLFIYGYRSYKEKIIYRPGALHFGFAYFLGCGSVAGLFAASLLYWYEYKHQGHSRWRENYMQIQ